jgi:hypothetical protein
MIDGGGWLSSPISARPIAGDGGAPVGHDVLVAHGRQVVEMPVHRGDHLGDLDHHGGQDLAQDLVALAGRSRPPTPGSAGYRLEPGPPGTGLGPGGDRRVRGRSRFQPIIGAAGRGERWIGPACRSTGKANHAPSSAASPAVWGSGQPRAIQISWASRRRRRGSRRPGRRAAISRSSAVGRPGARLRRG